MSITVASHKIVIAGIDVSSYVIGPQDSVQRSLAFPIAQASLTLKYTVTNIMTLAAGQSVLIYRSYTGSFSSANLIFTGTIESFDQHDIDFALTCYDTLNATKISVVNQVFLSSDTNSGILSNIFKTIVNTYCAGLSANNTSITSSGSVNIAQQLPYNNSYANTAMDGLATTLAWRYWYDPPTALVWFAPLGSVTNTNPINYLNMTTKPKWTSDKTSLCNYVKAIGALVTVQTTETFSGTGGLDTFTLANTPVSVQVQNPANTILKGGQNGDPGINYYVNIPKKQIVNVLNTAAGSSNYFVAYSYSRPLPVIATNAASIATYGTQMKVVTFTGISTLNDMNSRVALYLNTYSQPFTFCTVNVKNSANYGYDVGQMVAVTDPITGQTATLLVRSLNLNLRDSQDNISLGDEEFRLEAWLNIDTTARIKALEEQLSAQTVVTYPLVQLGHNVPVNRTSKTWTYTRINDTFIFGHPINGTFGRGIILDDFETGIGSWNAVNCTISSES